MSGFLSLLMSGEFIGAFAFLFAALLSIILHELGHGYIALRCGDSTAKVYGRLTLNPVKHFDPIGFCMFAFVGFGWARPVPINPYNFRHYRRGMFAVAIAGVSVNFILLFIATPCFLLVSYAAQYVDSTIAMYFWKFGYYFFYVLMLINPMLIVFNLLPINPLDGFRVIQSFTRPQNKFVRFMTKYGTYILLGFILMNYILSTATSGSVNILGWVADLLATPVRMLWQWILGLFGLIV